MQVNTTGPRSASVGLATQGIPTPTACSTLALDPPVDRNQMNQFITSPDSDSIPHVHEVLSNIHIILTIKKQYDENLAILYFTIEAGFA